MATSASLMLGDYLRELTQIAEDPSDKSLVQQSLRLSRLKLGMALETLEDLEQGVNVLEPLEVCANNIKFEIETLLATIRK